MKKQRVFALVLAVLMLLSGCKKPPEQPEAIASDAIMPKYEGAYLKKNTLSDLPYDFIKKSTAQFVAHSKSNSVYSPFSTYMALSMLAQCASGNTRTQILDLLGTDSIEKNTEKASEFLKVSLDKKTKFATSLWTDDSFNYNKDTIDILNKKLFTSVYSADFGTEQTNKQIRKWINENTNDFLSDSAKQISFDEQTSIALLSAVYFDSEWMDKFKKSDTDTGDFYLNDLDITEAEYMNILEEHSAVFEMTDCEAVKKSFSNGCEMVFILPKPDKSVAEVLNSGEYYEILVKNAPSRTYDINLSVPKFEIENSIDLIDGLKKLGISDAFSAENANLDAIGLNGHWINKFDQITRIDVNETSVKAASSTIFSGTYKSEDDENEMIDFKLNRPFIFAITTSEGIPLFVGTVNNPN